MVETTSEQLFQIIGQLYVKSLILEQEVEELQGLVMQRLADEEDELDDEDLDEDEEE